MSGSSSVKYIEHAIEKYRLKKTLIDPASSIQYSLDLKSCILEKSDDELRAVTVLSVVVRLSKPNDAFAQVFDEPLLDCLFKTITNSTSLDVIKAVLRILVGIVDGSIFETPSNSSYIIPFLNSTNTNLNVLETLANKLYLENVDMMVLSLNFINGYLDIDHLKLNSINHLSEFILHLQRSEFTVMLLSYCEDERFKKSLALPMDHIRKSFLHMHNMLLGLKVDPSSKYQTQILEIILSQVTNTETDKKRNLILERFSLFHLIDLYFFLENTNITFRKTYHQQVLFNSSTDQKFPLPLASLWVTNFLERIFKNDSSSKEYSEIQKHFFIRDLLQYNILTKFLELWVESKAQREDFDNICTLVEILVKHVNNSVDPEGELNIVEKVLNVFKDVTYKQLRQIQLNNYKKDVVLSTKKETVKFNKTLNDQVFEFVRNQRFLQLAKGSWVYSDLPFVKNSTQSSSSYYFIILSPNFKQLLYKEYKFTTQNTPDIDKTGTAIDITSIANFEIEEIHQVDPGAPPASNTKAINLVHKTIINNITLLNRKNRTLFSFYAKKEDSLIWLDGLNLLIGNFDHLSNELRGELNKLYDVRRTVQLLNFDKHSHEQSLLTQTTEEDTKNMNDLQFLEGLSAGFYYN